MDSQAFVERLKTWSGEFAEIVGQPIDDRFPAFLAKRIVESKLVEFADTQDVVHRGGKPIRIVGREHGRLRFEQVNGPGGGLCLVREIDQSDMGRLAAILDRLEGTPV